MKMVCFGTHLEQKKWVSQLLRYPFLLIDSSLLILQEQELQLFWQVLLRLV